MFFFIILLICCSLRGLSAELVDIGIVDDFHSRAGREERIAMEIALQDFYGYDDASSRPVLGFENYGSTPIQAASLAETLIKKNQVKALVGFQAWDAAAVSADIGNKSQIPVLTLADEVPTWASHEWPLIVSVARSQRAQMKAVAAIVQSYHWRRVTIIYETTTSSSDGIIPHLINDVQAAGAVTDELVPLSPWSPFADKNYIGRELSHLRAKQCRVFIVHTSSVKLAANIFIQAKKLGLMEKDSVWITTSTISNELDSLNTTAISSMQGVLGVKSFFPISRIRYRNFRAKFKVLFKSLYQRETYTEPGLYALQAYDALWALALAIDPISNSSAMSGKTLVDKIMNSRFEGLTGEFKFAEGRLRAQKIFRVVNVVGKSYNELGYWSDGLGFSVTLNKGRMLNKSMSILGPVFWPGGPWSAPRGYAIPTDANPLIIGVPANPAFNDFVKVECDNSSCKNPTVTGFSVDVFRSSLVYLPYNLSYKFVPFYGTYDSLIQQVQAQAVIGDTSIVAKRCEYAEFTQPYSESGLQAVIYLKQQHLDKAWLFKTPFTTWMWIFTALVNVYNGLVVWLIERRHNSGFRGSVWNQIGTMINLSFTTLFSLHGGKLHSNMSRIAMLVWLFVALVITQSYTASLTTLLTVQKLNTPAINIEELKRNGDKVGCDGKSFVGSYLEVALGFNPDNIVKVYNADQYPQLLMNGSIKAAFLITPYVKIFLAKYCRGFATSGTTYKVGGFGFVFAKGDPLLPDMSQAVVKVSEYGTLKELESKMLNKYNCSASNASDDNSGSLDTNSFWGLFLITFATSTLALLSYGASFLWQNWQCSYRRVAAEPWQVAADSSRHEPRDDESNMFATEMANDQAWV